MKLNQVPSLRVEDFPSETSWIGSLFIQLNGLFQSLNQILDNNIDYTYNIRSVTKTYAISAFLPFSFSWSYSNSAPSTVQILSATKGTQKTPTILLPAWSYDQSSNAVTVTTMVELSTTGVAALSGSYQFVIRASI